MLLSSLGEDFLRSNIVIESNTLKKDLGKIKLCAVGVLPWLFQSSTHSLWEWHAIFSFNLLDVSTCCCLLQFVFNFKKLVYSFDTKHWQKNFRAPFPVEFLHGKRVGAFCEFPSTTPQEAVYFRNASLLRCYPKGKGWVYTPLTANSWKSNSWFWVSTQIHIPDFLILKMFSKTQNLHAVVIILYILYIKAIVVFVCLCLWWQTW